MSFEKKFSFTSSSFCVNIEVRSDFDNLLTYMGFIINESSRLMFYLALLNKMHISKVGLHAWKKE